MSIVFVWDKITYQVSRMIQGPIILPNGEIVFVNCWDVDKNPIRGHDSTRIANIKLFDNTDLSFVASHLHGVLAEPIKLEIVNKCPRACKNPSAPYCNQCGGKTETTFTITKLPFTPRSQFDEPETLTKDWRCPNCDEQLHPDTHKCPNCNQPLVLRED